MNNSPSPTRLDNTDLWSGIAGVALGLFTARAGWTIGIGSINDPAAGFMLFYVGLGMCILAAALVVGAFADGGPTFADRWAGARWTKPVLVIGALAAFTLALDYVGFVLSAMALLLVLLRLVDPVRWSVAIPIAVVSPLVVWWVLKRALLIQLPSGLFGLG